MRIVLREYLVNKLDRVLFVVFTSAEILVKSCCDHNLFGNGMKDQPEKTNLLIHHLLCSPPSCHRIIMTNDELKMRKDEILTGTLQIWADPPGLVTRAHRRSQNPEISKYKR